MAVGDVHDGVVDAGAAGRSLPNQFPAGFGFAEIVEGQRFLPAIHKRGHLGTVPESQDREDGAENFFPHHGRIGRDPAQQGGFHPTRFAVRAASQEDISLFQVAGQPVEGLVPDHVDIVFRLLCPVGIQARQFLPERLDEGILDILMQEKIIRGDAGLSAVQALSPGNPPGRNLQIGLLVHDAGTLAAQFQDHRRQVRGLGLHENAGQGRTSGQENQVITVTEELPVHLPVSLHHAHKLLREGVGNKRLQRPGYRGHIGRGFQQGRTTGRNGTHQGVQQQLYGIVPRADNEGAAQRLPDNVSLRREAGHGSGHASPAGPAGRLADGFADFRIHQADFGHVGLLVALVQIGPQGIAQGFFPLFQAGGKGLQLRHAPVHFPGHARGEKRPLLFNQLPNAFVGGILNCHFAILLRFHRSAALRR